MNIDNRWIFLVAIATSATIGAVAAMQSFRRHRRKGHSQERATELNSWENEGGNVAPRPGSPILP